MINPITPEEARKCRPLIPDFVLQVVNELISEKARNNKKITIKQNEIVNKIIARHSDMTKKEIFDSNWLDFEDIYRDAGWKVVCDKPGYNEDYDAYFVFEFPGVSK